MNHANEARPMENAQVLRSRLRTDLTVAMKARQPEAVSALRTAIAAIDNAEAVAAPERQATAVGEHVAGAGVGVGSTEAVRRFLSTDELRALLQHQVTDRVAEADRYDAYGQSEAADRLRREAEVLGKYLGG
jgi:uncharacterized protein YqeY